MYEGGIEMLTASFSIGCYSLPLHSHDPEATGRAGTVSSYR